MLNQPAGPSLRGLVIMISIILGMSSLALAQEKKMKPKDLPASVKTAFHKEYPQARINGASSEKEKGKVYYEIESVDGKMKRDLLYSPDGAIVEVEEGITMDMVPAAVKSALEKEYPKSAVTKSEKVTREGVTNYEFQLKVGKGRKEVGIDSAGTILKGKAESNEKEEKEDDDDD